MTARRRSYSDDDRLAAIVLAADLGPSATSRQLGIPKCTISRWCAAAGVDVRSQSRTRAATDAAGEKWHLRRLTVVDRLGNEAEAALACVQRALAADRLGAARQAATTMGTLIDKAQLLSGGATARTATKATGQANLVLDEFARRRSRQGAVTCDSGLDERPAEAL